MSSESLHSIRAIRRFHAATLLILSFLGITSWNAFALTEGETVVKITSLQYVNAWSTYRDDGSAFIENGIHYPFPPGSPGDKWNRYGVGLGAPIAMLRGTAPTVQIVISVQAWKTTAQDFIPYSGSYDIKTRLAGQVAIPNSAGLPYASESPWKRIQVSNGVATFTATLDALPNLPGFDRLRLTAIGRNPQVPQDNSEQGGPFANNDVFLLYCRPAQSFMGTSPLRTTILYVANASRDRQFQLIHKNGAANEEATFWNAWSNLTAVGMVGPANLKLASDPLGQLHPNSPDLFYYRAGTSFGQNALSWDQLLSTPSHTGQCGSWATLLMAAGYANGISTTLIGANPAEYVVRVPRGFIVNNWATDVPGSRPTGDALFSGWFRFNGPNWEMTPAPMNGIFGGFRNLAGLEGQNSPTPSQKVFSAHFFVRYGTAYVDPSYGQKYSGSNDFESKAVNGFFLPLTPQMSPLFAEIMVRPKLGYGIRFSDVPIF